MPGISSSQPTREGYTFEGWYDTPTTTGGTQYYKKEGAFARIWNKASDATLYARWSANATYTVSFDINNGIGTIPSNATVTYLVSMPALDTTAKPTRDGYEFMEWYDNVDYAAGMQYYTAAGASAQTWNKASGATLYAGWKPRIYTIAWDPQDGSVTTGKDVVSQTFGDALKIPAATTREGYIFAGWWTTVSNSLDEKSVGPGKDITQVEARNATYYARWTKVTGTVTLKAPAGASFTQAQVDAFNGASGNPSAALNPDGTQVTITYTVDTKSFSLDGLRPSRDGCKFQSWTPAVSVPSWDSASESYAAAAYTAVLARNSYAISYEDEKGGALVDWTDEYGASSDFVLPASYNGATEPALPALWKRGYTWGMWTVKGSTSPIGSVPKGSGDIVIVAHFTADACPIEIDLDGGASESASFKDVTLTYDDKTLALSANIDNDLKKAGHTFSHFVAYKEDKTTKAINENLYPGETYAVLGLGDTVSDDVHCIKAVWIERIAVAVPASVDMGIQADFDDRTIYFRYGEDSYSGGKGNVYAPLTFVSYTTAPVRIVAVTDDGSCADAATEVFGEGVDQVGFKIAKSDTEENVQRMLPLGRSTGALDDLVLDAATTDAGKATTFYLGMYFGGLMSLDIVTPKECSSRRRYASARAFR